ncbi:hypothetical protein [Xanthobacter tagetidis]|uniref:Uncharacterized protein n=1 Tax=Xanthobacter tagetidis TaxID=60216 RepID=A0A3L7AIH8_9HYPH|nr:hypothetical protein [Xanthobacter tagetidis]MBB6306238.1 hypothetical protein [Xanthobacter tagetidis]RLP79520.1 hypothetical protein D9R14_07595 [Xanthobacter tagetidis]
MAQKLIAAARRARQRAWLHKVLTRPQCSYARSLERDQRREHLRTMAYGGLDWLEDRDTEWSRAFVAERQRVAASKLAARRAGDPLNLTGHTERTKGERRAAAKKARRDKPTTARIEDADKIMRTVEVTGRFIRGLDPHQKRAMELFDRDWALATRSLKCPGFEPKVDGGSAQREPIAMIEAQRRLAGLKAHLGERDWTCLLAIAVGRAGAAELHRRGGPQHVVGSHEIGRIMDEASGFYGLGGSRKDRFLAACVSVVREMEKAVG